MTAPAPPERAATPMAAQGSASPVADPAGATSPPGGAPAQTSPQQGHGRVAAGTTPGPETAPPPSLLGQAAVRARDKTPAGSAPDADDALPAGSRGLSGAAWRAAVKAQQSKRRRPARSAAAKPAAAPPLPPATTGTALTATATCIGRCDWTAGPGDPAEIDKAAEKHTTKPPKHPTNLVSKVVAAPERAA